MVLALANDLVITLAVHREVKIWRLTTEPEQKCVFTLDEFGISVGWTQQNADSTRMLMLMPWMYLVRKLSTGRSFSLRGQHQRHWITRGMLIAWFASASQGFSLQSQRSSQSPFAFVWQRFPLCLADRMHCASSLCPMSSDAGTSTSDGSA